MTDVELGLRDQDYWTDPHQHEDDIEQRLHVDLDFRGICIGGPSNVSLDSRSTIPLVVWQNDSFANLWRLRFAEKGVIVAVDHRANIAYARQGLEPDPERDDHPGDEPDDDPGNTGSSMDVVDLRERLRLPWVRAGYHVVVLTRDKPSNRVHIQVGPGGDRYHDEAVEDYIDELRGKAKRTIEPPVTDLPIPHYGPMPASPAIPADPGIAFTLPRVILVRSEGVRTPWALQGSFRLPAQRRDVVKEGTALPGHDMRGATAIVGITFVFVGADVPGPWLVRIAVPTFDPIPADPAPRIVTGHFLVDLLDLPGAPDFAQTYFVYAFSSEVMSGPVTSAYIDEPMLPPDVFGAT